MCLRIFNVFNSNFPVYPFVFSFFPFQSVCRSNQIWVLFYSKKVCLRYRIRFKNESKTVLAYTKFFWVKVDCLDLLLLFWVFFLSWLILTPKISSGTGGWLPVACCVIFQITPQCNRPLKIFRRASRGGNRSTSDKQELKIKIFDSFSMANAYASENQPLFLSAIDFLWAGSAQQERFVTTVFL